LPSLESQSSSDRFTYNAAPHTLASNQLSLFIALAEKLISNLRMQIAVIFTWPLGKDIVQEWLNNIAMGK